MSEYSIPYPLDPAPLVTKISIKSPPDYQSPHGRIWGTLAEDTFRLHIQPSHRKTLTHKVFSPIQEATDLFLSDKGDIEHFIDQLGTNPIFAEAETISSVADYQTATFAIERLGFRVDRHNGDIRSDEEILTEARSNHTPMLAIIILKQDFISLRTHLLQIGQQLKRS